MNRAKPLECQKNSRVYAIVVMSIEVKRCHQIRGMVRSLLPITLLQININKTKKSKTAVVIKLTWVQGELLFSSARVFRKQPLLILNGS